MRWTHLLALVITLGARAADSAQAQQPLHVTSPDGRNDITIKVRDGRLYYSLQRAGRPVILPSMLGFEFRGARPLRDSLRIVTTGRNQVDESWTQPWGEVARVRNQHNELRVTVAETIEPRRQFSVIFRAFDDGVGFRYDVPAQQALGEFEMSNELTEFALADDARAWWIPSNPVEGRPLRAALFLIAR